MAFVPTTAPSCELGVIGRMNAAFGVRFLAAFLAAGFLRAGAFFAAGRLAAFFAALRAGFLAAGLFAAFDFFADFFFAGIDALRMSVEGKPTSSRRTGPKLSALLREASIICTIFPLRTRSLQIGRAHV